MDVQKSIDAPPSDIRSEEISYASENEERQMRKFKFEPDLGSQLFR